MSPMSLMVFILLVLFFPCFFAWYNSAGQKGKRGEMRVSSILSHLPEEYTVLNDLIFKTDKGTTQIDHIVVSKYGIFAIETKNYRGKIYGDDNRKEWTQIIVTKVTFTRNLLKKYTYVTKNRFYNPVKQSLGHVFKLKELLSAFSQMKIVPIVVFVGEAQLDNVNSRQHVVYEEQLLSVINMYKTIYLTEHDIQTVLTILTENNIRETVSNRQHVKNLQTAARETKTTVNSGICPRCGGRLIERKGKYGTFYGCSNYPNCKFAVH